MTNEVAIPDAYIKIKIGNREFPVVRSTRCGTCMHPARFQIEERILLNYGLPSISKWVSDKRTTLEDGTEQDWPELSVVQLKYHKSQGHIPADADMISELAKRRAEALGIDLEEYRGRFVDHVVASEIVLARGVERLVKGEIEPDVKDTLTAAKLLGDLEAAKNGDSSVEEWQQLMVLYFKTVQAAISQEQWLQIMNKISAHPLVRTVRERMALEGNSK